MTHARLADIASRQKTSRVRDALFAACIALAAAVSFVSLSTAAHAAITHVASR
jgi:hypothetical protein